MNKNSSINCNVDDCKYNCNEDKACTLQKINVVKEGSCAQDKQETNCNSFECKC